MSFELHNPNALWLLLAIPAYLWAARRRRLTAAVRYPTVRHLKRLPGSFRKRSRFLLPVLRTTGLVLLVLVLARPVRPIEIQELPSQGIAIGLLVDRSASMGAPDNRLMYEGRLTLRSDVARDVVKQFVEGDKDDLTGRPNDLVGLFTFATYPQTDHPFSLDHTSLLNVIENMSAEKPFLDDLGRPTDNIEKAARLRDRFGRVIPRVNPMQYTSLKTGIEYAADKLLLLGEDLSRPTGGLHAYDLKSKVLVLLTDGEPTVADARQSPDYPDEATIKKLADAGIKVYFIQILSRERYRERPDGTVEVILPRQGGVFGMMSAQRQAEREAEVVNESIEEARKLARRTGGVHFLATSGDQVKEVYEKIDDLERSSVGGRTVFSHEERYRTYLLAAMGLLAAETVLGLTWLRRAP